MFTFFRAAILFSVGVVGAAVIGTTLQAGAPAEPGWNAKAAAQYLDQRAEWWTTWPNAARDRGTYCMSCHTTLPYALARPALRGLSANPRPRPPKARSSATC